MPEEASHQKPIENPNRSLRVPPWAVTLGVLLMAAGIFALVYGDWNRWESDLTTQSTNDAYVKADITTVNTKATGILDRLDVTDYQHVKQGQPIASIRSDDYRAQVAAAEAALRAAEAGVAELKHQQEAADAKVAQSRVGIVAAEHQSAAALGAIAASEAAIQASEAELISARAVLDNARQELERQKGLYAGKAATLQRLQMQTAQTRSAEAGFEARQVAVVGARAQLEIRKAEFERARSAIESAKTDLNAAVSARAVLSARAAEIRADVAARQAALDAAKISAGYTSIVAPSSGYIAVRSALPGQIVTIGTSVVSLVNEDSWILANFKETQLRRVRPGDAAEIRVDMFPGQVWKGRVAAIAPATGSQTALIGPDNATGNFTKIVQRIPVKIMPEKGQDTSMLRPGMSASVSIQPGNRT